MEIKITYEYKIPPNKNVPSQEGNLIEAKQIGFLELTSRFAFKLVNWLTWEGEPQESEKDIFRIQMIHVCDHFTPLLFSSREARKQALSSEYKLTKMI